MTTEEIEKRADSITDKCKSKLEKLGFANIKVWAVWAPSSYRKQDFQLSVHTSATKDDQEQLWSLNLTDVTDKSAAEQIVEEYKNR